MLSSEALETAPQPRWVGVSPFCFPFFLLFSFLHIFNLRDDFLKASLYCSVCVSLYCSVWTSLSFIGSFVSLQGIVYSDPIFSRKFCFPHCCSYAVHSLRILTLYQWCPTIRRGLLFASEIPWNDPKPSFPCICNILCQQTKKKKKFTDRDGVTKVLRQLWKRSFPPFHILIITSRSTGFCLFLLSLFSQTLIHEQWILRALLLIFLHFQGTHQKKRSANFSCKH